MGSKSIHSVKDTRLLEPLSRLADEKLVDCHFIPKHNYEDKEDWYTVEDEEHNSVVI